MMPVRVKDLKSLTETPFPRPCLHCCICGGEYSADRGDYFMHSADHVFRCCDVPMELVIKRCYYEAL